MTSILILYLPAVMLPLILHLPAAGISRARDGRWGLLPFVHVPAVTVWMALIMSGYGSQSLGNMLEIFIIGAVASVSAYVKVLIIDQFTDNHVLTSRWLAGLLVVLAFALRSFMPVIPE